MQPRYALHRQCIGVHRLYDIRSLLTARGEGEEVGQTVNSWCLPCYCLNIWGLPISNLVSCSDSSSLYVNDFILITLLLLYNIAIIDFLEELAYVRRRCNTQKNAVFCDA